MKRLPIVPTLIVAVAVALMVMLGLWQLRRAEWKEGLVARYAAATSLPPVAWPESPAADDRLLFRRAAGRCLQVTGWSARAGHNRAGETGWRHIADCRTAEAGPRMRVDMGWSRRADPPRWAGGQVSGVIAQDRAQTILLVSDRAAAGLEPSARPNPADIPNNHRSYAVQWFLFAASALVIYALAVRKRLKPLSS